MAFDLTQAWIEHVLRSECVELDQNKYVLTEEELEVPKDFMRRAYREYRKNTNHARVADDKTLFKRLFEYAGIVGTKIQINGQRFPAVVFPGLAACRATFMQNVVKDQSWDWT